MKIGSIDRRNIWFILINSLNSKIRYKDPVKLGYTQHSFPIFYPVRHFIRNYLMNV